LELAVGYSTSWIAMMRHSFYAKKFDLF